MSSAIRRLRPESSLTSDNNVSILRPVSRQTGLYRSTDRALAPIRRFSRTGREIRRPSASALMQRVSQLEDDVYDINLALHEHEQDIKELKAKTSSCGPCNQGARPLPGPMPVPALPGPMPICASTPPCNPAINPCNSCIGGGYPGGSYGNYSGYQYGPYNYGYQNYGGGGGCSTCPKGPMMPGPMPGPMPYGPGYPPNHHGPHGQHGPHGPHDHREYDEDYDDKKKDH